MRVQLITSSLARTINANFKPCSLQVDGVGPSAVSCRHTVNITMHPICLKQPSTSTRQSSSYPSPVSMHCYVVDKPFHVITGLDSAAICQLMADRALEPLADPAPAKVELLLCGSDLHRCYTGPKFFYSGDCSLKFVRTLFGLTLGGTVHSQASRAIASRTSQPSAKPDPEQLFHLLWTQEEIPEESTLDCLAIGVHNLEMMLFSKKCFTQTIKWLEKFGDCD